MNVLVWILSGLLVVAFLGAGTLKLLTPKEKLLENPKMAWAGDFNAGQIRVIGLVEVLGAIGLVLPWLLDIAPVLTPLAAVGLAAAMVGAVVVHLRRGEKDALAGPLVLGVLALVVAVLRFAQL